jgi:hypothetical protein
VEDIPHLDMPTHVITELSIEPQGTVTTTKKLAESSHDVSGGGLLSVTYMQIRSKLISFEKYLSFDV